jgi:hypothetical protein
MKKYLRYLTKFHGLFFIPLFIIVSSLDCSTLYGQIENPGVGSHFK